MFTNIVANTKNQIVKFHKDEEGQGLVEYIIIGVLIALVVFGTIKLLGGSVKGRFGEMNQKVNEVKAQ